MRASTETSMAFVADRQARRVFDPEGGWELTAQSSMHVTNFTLTQTASAARVVFTAKRIRRANAQVPRDDGYSTEWSITSVGHDPCGSSIVLNPEYQRRLICEAMSAYGFFWGEGAGPALLVFE